MKNKQRRILPYREVPNGSLFKVLKEGGFSPREGVFEKVGDSHATSSKGDAIFALADMVCVLRFPEESDARRAG